MRALTVMEMGVVAGGQDAGTGGGSFLQRLAQCTLDTMIGGATGAALGVATGGVGTAPLAVIGLFAGSLASDACNSL